MTLGVNRVRAELDRRDRRHAKALRDAAGRGRPSLERHIRRDRAARRAEREPILESAALVRVLAALPDTDAGAVTAANVVGLVVDVVHWRAAHLLDVHPAEALQGRSSAAHRAAAEKLEALVADVEALSIARAVQLAELAIALRRPVDHRWAAALAGRHVGRRGRAADVASAWRGVLVRELDTLLPAGVERRHASIANLLALGGDGDVSRCHVRTILGETARR